MATLKNLSALMILLVVNMALLPTATLAIGGNPTCAKGMIADCGSQFFQIIVFGRTFAPTDECCHELVKAGKDCQNQYVKLILSTHRPIKGTISDLYRRSNETWNKCVAAANSVSPPKLAH